MNVRKIMVLVLMAVMCGSQAFAGPVEARPHFEALARDFRAGKPEARKYLEDVARHEKTSVSSLIDEIDSMSKKPDALIADRWAKRVETFRSIGITNPHMDAAAHEMTASMSMEKGKAGNETVADAMTSMTHFAAPKVDAGMNKVTDKVDYAETPAEMQFKDELVASMKADGDASDVSSKLRKSKLAWIVKPSQCLQKAKTLSLAAKQNLTRLFTTFADSLGTRFEKMGLSARDVAGNETLLRKTAVQEALNAAAQDGADEVGLQISKEGYKKGDKNMLEQLCPFFRPDTECGVGGKLMAAVPACAGAI